MLSGSGSCNFSVLKISLVQIRSKLNWKPQDYLYLPFRGLCVRLQNCSLITSHVRYMTKHRLRAIAYKYRESHDRTENLDFLLLHQKDPFDELFSEIYFQRSREFTFLWDLGKFEIRLNQPRCRWNLSKIVHFQHARTERRELAWISYSHGL